jgi:REP element-mobilizing transposase RayT
MPIAFSLDLHSNMTPAKMALTPVWVACKEYPHVDATAAGATAMDILVKWMHGEIKPVSGFVSLPLLLTKGNTYGSPTREIKNAMQEYGKTNGALDVSWLHGFPFADVAHVLANPSLVEFLSFMSILYQLFPRPVARVDITLPRQIIPGSTYFVTRRCTQRCFLLKPKALTNQIFLYCIAVAAQETGIIIHAACVMSNHWHAIVTDPDGRIADFYGWVHKYGCGVQTANIATIAGCGVCQPRLGWFAAFNE